MPKPIIRSPIESDPKLIRGFGVIATRWAILEDELAYLLRSFVVYDNVAIAIYYCPGSFLQRLDIINEVLRVSLVKEKHLNIALLLTARINRIWKKRNNLIHCQYGYRIEDHLGGRIVTKFEPGENTDLSKVWVPIIVVRDGEGNIIDQSDPKRQKREFGYHSRPTGSAPEGEFVPVNEGTFLGHADAVSKRVRQIRRLGAAIRRGRVPIKRDAR